MIRILALLTLLMISYPAMAPAYDGTLHIAYPGFAPFFYRGQDGRMAGLFYEIIHEAIEQRMRIAVSWDEYPWKRCQELVRTGGADAMLTTITPERLAYTKTHSAPVFVRSASVFSYADHPRLAEMDKLHSFADIKKAGLSIITYLGNGWITKNAEPYGITVHRAPQQDMIWDMLSHKRADIVLEWPGGAWPEIIKFGLQDRIVETKAALPSVSIHLMIGLKSPYVHILQNFNEVIKEMHEQGEIEKIAAKMPAPRAKD